MVDEHNTFPKLTTRHVKLDKFTFGTPWLPDLLSKHWFALSIWNFCRWVVDVRLCKTSPVAKSKEKRMFSQAIQTTIIKTFFHFQIHWLFMKRKQPLLCFETNQFSRHYFLLHIHLSFMKKTTSPLNLFHIIIHLKYVHWTWSKTTNKQVKRWLCLNLSTLPASMTRIQ